MLTTLLLLLLYFGVAAAVARAVRGLKRRIDWPYLLVFWLLPIFFLFPCFFSSRTPLPVDHALLLPPWSTLGPATRYNANLNDVATQIAPWAKAVRMAWKEGALPLRDRWNGCGTPLAANGQSAAFSPFSFLMMLLPLAHAFTLLVAVKLFLAACGMWLWLVELKASRQAALFGAVSFALSFAMTPWLLFPDTSVICLWPWALFATELLQDEAVRSRGFQALLAVLLLGLLSGHAESAASGAAFAGLWLLARWRARELRDPKTFFRLAGLAVVAAAGLTAFFLVPHLLAIQASNRAILAAQPFWKPVFPYLPHGPIWSNGFLTPFFPRILGDAVHSPMVGGGTGSFPEMAQGYFGIAGWACALLLLRPGRPRSRTSWTLALPLLSGFGAATGLWPFQEILAGIPGLRMMFPLRFFVWLPVAGAAIAALELDRLRADLSRSRRSVFFFLCLIAGLAFFALATFSHFAPLHAASGGLPSQRNAITLVLITLAGAALAVLFAAWRPAALRTLPVLLTLVTGAELLRQGQRLYQFGSPAKFFPETPLIAFLRARPGPFRVLGEGSTLFPNSNVFAGLEDIRTHDAVERRDYVEFLDAHCGYDPAAYFKFIRDVNAPALDLLNVKYLVCEPGRAPPGQKWRTVYSASDGSVFENLSALPRVFAPRRLPPDGERNDRVFLSDYREMTNTASFRTRVLPGDGQALVLASLVQDGGWSAKDETGQSLPTERAWGPFLALRLPPGEHAVYLRYCPPGFLAGIAISLATLGAWTAFSVRPKNPTPRLRAR